ncbi:MAG: TIGR00269 family protein [Candidatus Hodarchaeota archaeon]
MTDKCYMCNGTTIFFRPYSGEALCEKCFKESLITSVRAAVSKFTMLHHTDRIAVAYSGGKDSLVLLSTLIDIQRRFPHSEVIAVTLLEGSQHDQQRLKTQTEVTHHLKVEHVTSTYQELFSLTLEDIVERANILQSPLSACAYCGTLRRQGLNILARKINADKLALGHNLDDEVQSMLMNLIRGDIQRLSRITPFLKGVPGWLVPRIKPLYHLLEDEIALYAQLLKLPIYHPPCPYKETSMRSEIREWLNSFEARHPGSKYNLYATFSKIIQALDSGEKPPFQKCRTCGEITSQEICAVCLHRKNLTEDFRKR